MYITQIKLIWNKNMYSKLRTTYILLLWLLHYSIYFIRCSNCIQYGHKNKICKMPRKSDSKIKKKYEEKRHRQRGKIYHYQVLSYNMSYLYRNMTCRFEVKLIPVVASCMLETPLDLVLYTRLTIWFMWYGYLYINYQYMSFLFECYLDLNNINWII